MALAAAVALGTFILGCALAALALAIGVAIDFLFTRWN